MYTCIHIQNKFYLWRGKPHSRYCAGQEAATKAGGTNGKTIKEVKELCRLSVCACCLAVVFYCRCVY